MNFLHKTFLLVLIFSGASSFSFTVYAAESVFEEAESGRQSKAQKEKETVELRELEKFEDIAVIQKKYLDKTSRFEFWIAGALALNSQFHNLFGANAAFSYHFNETWGLELQGAYFTNMEKSITNNLSTKQNIATKSIVVPEAFYGLSLRWSPIYGKISLREKTINPFEMYFSLGGGMTMTEDGQSVPTIHGGVGQVYPMNKNTTFRWALSYNFFSANARADLNGSIRGQKVNSSLFYLSAGVSFFFPFSEAR